MEIVRNRIFDSEDESGDEVNYHFNDGMDSILNDTLDKIEIITETPKRKVNRVRKNLVSAIIALEPFHTPKKKCIEVNTSIDEKKSTVASKLEIERKRLQAIIRLKDSNNKKKMKNFMQHYFFEIESWPINILRHFLSKKLNWKGTFDLACFFYGNGLKKPKVVENIIKFYNDYAAKGWNGKLVHLKNQMNKIKTFEDDIAREGNLVLGPLYNYYCMQSNELVYIDDKFEL